MKIVRPGNHEYDKDCVISNARFNYRPSAIYYCENAQDVSQAIADARTKGLRVRIRSGGHQHEGMCSANGVLLIDVSAIRSFQFVGGNPGLVWIGAGAALGDVYVELWRRGYYFPGGACSDVHVGGLTQGGGWGFGLRQFGLTCDSLIGAEIVTAAGKIIREIPRPGYHEDQRLLQALRGGGGGNFCVVTRFCFRLHPMTEVYVDVSLTWGDAQLPGNSLDRLLKRWMNVFPRDEDRRLTTFMRLLVAPSGTNDRLLLSGRYLGSIPDAQRTLDKLLEGQPPPRVIMHTPSPTPPPKPKRALRLDPRERERLREHLGTHPGYQPGPLLSGAAADASSALTSTCAGVPFRHKISSAFVRPQVSASLVPTLTALIRKTTPVPPDVARQYVSLHCLGGAAFDERLPSAYAFRERGVLLQYQAWWQAGDTRRDKPCIAWIENFRKTMAPYTDGAFINFVDRDIPLEEYYKGKLPFLVEVKRQWDPGDFFKFEMSIPPG
jgi:hypothetical protein